MTPSSSSSPGARSPRGAESRSPRPIQCPLRARAAVGRRGQEQRGTHAPAGERRARFHTGPRTLTGHGTQDQTVTFRFAKVETLAGSHAVETVGDAKPHAGGPLELDARAGDGPHHAASPRPLAPDLVPETQAHRPLTAPPLTP